MEVKLAMGAAVDIASGKELTDGLDSLGERILGGSQRPYPTLTYRPKADVMPTAGPLTLDLGKPPVGRMWNIMGVTTYGVDDATTTANAKVALYCGDSANVTLFQLKIPALVVPSFLSITKGVLWCLDSESLFASVTGAAASAPIGINVHIAEWREVDVVAHSGR